MKLSDFRYTAPKSITAKYPAEPRDQSKLLVLDRKTGDVEDRVFTDIVDYFKKGDCLVVNESRVFPARLIGKKEKTNAQIEVMLLRELSQKDTSSLWDVIVDPARKVRIGNKIYFDDGKLYCEVIDNTTSRGRTVRFNHSGDLFKTIERIGLMPLPPYIGREPTEDDREYYQTIFAKTKAFNSNERLREALLADQDHLERARERHCAARIAEDTVHALILAQAYVKRADVAVVAFRGEGADVLLPPTRSLTRAKRALAALPGGGGTPLASGLSLARQLGEAVAARGSTPVLVFLTDGSANIALDGTRGRARAQEDALLAARAIAGAGHDAVVIDISPRPRPEAARLAEAMRARYLPLPCADAHALHAAVAQVA